MATTVETLEDIYKLTDQYSAPLKRITEGTTRFGLKVLSVMGLITGLAGAAGLAGLGKSVLSNALEIERLTGTFTALSGSADKARQKLGWLQAFAQTSIGQFADLAAAGAQLEASGLNMERILPLISNISAAFGGTREQVLELASAFGRVPSGVFGESMEIFRRFGITAGDLMAQGLKMSGNGQFQATAVQMLTAIENVAKKKFGQIGEALGNSLGVKISNLQDAWQQMTATLGETFFPVLKQIVDSVTQFINFIKESGWVKSFGESITATFGQVFGDGNAIFRFFSYVLAFLEYLPEIIYNSWKIIKGVFQSIADGFLGVFNFIGQKYTDFLNILKHGMDAYLDFLHMIPGIGSFLNKKDRAPDYKFTPITASDILRDITGVAFPDYAESISKRGDELFRKFQAFQQRPGGAGVPVFEGDFFNGQSVAQSMQQTAQNTAIIAGNTNPLKELRKFVVGGGPLAAFGITPTELGRGRSREQRVQVSVGTRPLEQAVGDIVNETVGEMLRQGVLRPGF